MTQQTRQRVLIALTVLITGIISLILSLGGDVSVFLDAVSTAIYDGQTEGTELPHQTAVPAHEATETIPRVEYTPTQETIPPPPPLPAQTTIRLKDNFGYTYANIRAGYDIHAPVVGRMLPGEQYLFLGAEGEWYKIEVPGGVGYIASWVTIKE